MLNHTFYKNVTNIMANGEAFANFGIRTQKKLERYLEIILYKNQISR